MTVMVEGEVEPLRTGCFTGFALTGSPGTFWNSESSEGLVPLSPVRRASGLAVSAQPVGELPCRFR